MLNLKDFANILAKQLMNMATILEKQSQSNTINASKWGGDVTQGASILASNRTTHTTSNGNSHMEIFTVTLRQSLVDTNTYFRNVHII